MLAFELDQLAEFHGQDILASLVGHNDTMGSVDLTLLQDTGTRSYRERISRLNAPAPTSGSSIPSSSSAETRSEMKVEARHDAPAPKVQKNAGIHLCL